MKLGVCVDQVFFKSNDTYFTDAAFIQFLLSFQKYFEKIEFISRVKISEKGSRYALSKEKNTVVELPYYNNIFHLCTQYPFYINKVKHKLKKFVTTSDLLFVMVPHPIALTILNYCTSEHKKVFVFVRQNMLASAEIRYRGIKHYPALLVTHWLNFLTDKYCKKHPVLTMGSEMYQRYIKINPNTFLFANSKFTKADIVSKTSLKEIRWDKCVNILFVGRLDPEKGIDYLLRALAAIKCFNFKLDIVGEGPLKHELMNTGKVLGLEEKVAFADYVPYGEALYQHYLKADMFILPSLGAEGLPQALLEAMAKGVLVLASNNSGIPGVIEHGKNGFLFKPGNSQDLSTVLENICLSNSDTIAIRAKALDTVQQYTQEKQHEVFRDICLRLHNLDLTPGVHTTSC